MDTDIVNAKGRIIDGIEIQDANVVFRNDVEIPQDIVDYANSKGVGITRFGGVD